MLLKVKVRQGENSRISLLTDELKNAHPLCGKEYM